MQNIGSDIKYAVNSKLTELKNISNEMKSVAISLDMIITDMDNVPQNQKAILQDIVRRVNDISKNLIAKVQDVFVISETTCNSGDSTHSVVLVDDSEIFRNTWELEADSIATTLIAYSTPKDFFKNALSLNKENPVYIDINLSADMDGIELSEWVSKIGFKYIYLLTGEDIKKINPPLWVTGIFDKLTPFQAILKKHHENKQ